MARSAILLLVQLLGLGSARDSSHQGSHLCICYFVFSPIADNRFLWACVLSVFTSAVLLALLLWMYVSTDVSACRVSLKLLTHHETPATLFLSPHTATKIILLKLPPKLCARNRQVTWRACSLGILCGFIPPGWMAKIALHCSRRELSLKRLVDQIVFISIRDVTWR